MGVLDVCIRCAGCAVVVVLFCIYQRGAHSAERVLGSNPDRGPTFGGFMPIQSGPHLLTGGLLRDSAPLVSKGAERRGLSQQHVLAPRSLVSFGLLLLAFAGFNYIYEHSLAH